MMETHSAGGIVLNPFGEVAVVSQKGLSWSLPKGHIEENEDILTAAYREIEEETGIKQLRYLQHCPVYWRYKIGLNGEDDTSEKKHLHFFVFLTDVYNLDPQDSDNPEAKWLHHQTVSQRLTHKKDKAFFNDQISTIEGYLTQLINITTTTATKEDAIKLATSLIESKLVACSQISDSITSIYRWNDAIETETEYKLQLKSSRKHYKAIQAFIDSNHPYDCPECLITDCSSYGSNYSQWLQDNLV